MSYEEFLAPRPPARWVGALGVLVVLILTFLLALYAVLFVPLYWGTTIAPVSVLLALATNIGMPLLIRKIVNNGVVAALPVLQWIAIVLSLSQTGPGGDVLLPGSGAMSTVALVVMFGGLAAGMATVYVSEMRRQRRRLR